MLKMTTETPAQRFETRAAAKAAHTEMRNWNARIVSVPRLDEDGYPTLTGVLIRCGGGRYLREDGYVN